MSNAHTDVDVYISESDLCFWLVVMQGPTSSPYEAGTFLYYLDLSEYPSKPPAARFLTQVLHPNITKVSHVKPYSLCVVINSILARQDLPSNL